MQLNIKGKLMLSDKQIEDVLPPSNWFRGL